MSDLLDKDILKILNDLFDQCIDVGSNVVMEWKFDSDPKYYREYKKRVVKKYYKLISNHYESKKFLNEILIKENRNEHNKCI